MADVLLTHSYHLPYDAKQVRKMQPYPPLGTLYAAAVLRERGLAVTLFDTMLQEPGEFARALTVHRPRIVAVYEDDFNFLTKMCLTRMREVAWEMAAVAREAGAVTIAHGSDACDHAEEFLRHGFDFVISGDAERALADLCQRAMKRLDSDGVLGVAWLGEGRGEILRTPPRAHSPSLLGMPPPARDLVDMERYRRAWRQAHGRFSLNLVSSRGCPFRCNWCAKPIFGDGFHVRSAAEVAEEMHVLQHQYGAEHLWFSDDIFALNRHWAEDFAAEVERLECSVPFKAQSRADLMSAEVAQALRRAGCEEIWMGVESGSQRVLDAMDKGLTVSDVFRATANLRRAGIRACFFLQFGYPGESLEDIQQTVSMVRQACPDDIGVSVSYPLPNTRFYEAIRDQMGEKQNWRDSDDLSVMFKGTYSDAFYRALRDALHAEVNEAAGRRGAEPFSERVRMLWQRVTELEPISRNSDRTLLSSEAVRRGNPSPSSATFIPVQSLASGGGLNG